MKLSIRYKSLATGLKNYGFTLMELLVVIALVGIISTITFFVIDPIELSRRTRDTVRLADLKTLNQAITVAVQEAPPASASGMLCSGGIPQPCAGNSIPVSETNRKSDGSGWVKINLSANSTTALPVLPVDPQNKDLYFYTYTASASAWELNAVLESKEYRENKRMMIIDGGNNDNKYEVGSNLKLGN